MNNCWSCVGVVARGHQPTDRPTLIYESHTGTDTRAVRVKYASGTALSVFITSSRWGVLIDNGEKYLARRWRRQKSSVPGLK